MKHIISCGCGMGHDTFLFCSASIARINRLHEFLANAVHHPWHSAGKRAATVRVSSPCIVLPVTPFRLTAVRFFYARTRATTMVREAPTSTTGLLVHQWTEAAAMAVLTATTISILVAFYTRMIQLLIGLLTLPSSQEIANIDLRKPWWLQEEPVLLIIPSGHAWRIRSYWRTARNHPMGNLAATICDVRYCI